ncbi:MAG TPA: hypothetical protein PK234_01410 [Candidatus Portnoybacteria bacterium]|jgi:hypothetical protein|nr:hypothetical protein [Candidatus Portnoybacteria bacterium]MDD5752421.1 hypothetical protein [Candidatus Portnoybacteria bacterium]HOZ16512.1 hypothetical protein [Candidatus Portnoybacteria bacterium]HPH52272.1 hypothetical protein [Candidatus Portnoybacteria bacterium]HPM28414.1 hypothetical protein [Candidatus Portnoybacteria bacterium]
MKKVNILIIIVCLILIGGAVYFNLTKKSSSEINNNDNQIVGGDRDEHECIPSAGYSWCEAKEKCLRIWEETCYEDAEQEIEYQLALKYEKNISDIMVDITKSDETHITGNISFLQNDQLGEGGLFLAVKKGNVWKLVYDGNGSIDCNLMKEQYKFSDEILKPNFCD